MTVKALATLYLKTLSRSNWKAVPSRHRQQEADSIMITLGLNYSQMHDSSACLVRDGELLFAVAEERISRVKHDARFPGLAIRACLDFAKIRADRVDEVCVGWQIPGATFRHDLKLYRHAQVADQLSERVELRASFRQHVASKWWRKSVPSVSSVPTKARVSLRGSPSRSRAQCLFVFRL